MLQVGIGRLEVPGEISLCIYISGCQNHCRNCHYSDLKSTEYGVPLEDNISVLIGAYLSRIFDYVKVGSYRPALGDLFCRTTNQRLYLNQNGKFTDVTSNFWKQFN